ncbi:MAG: GNAT family N-acetyltransferase [Candidatus Hodarchaeota archaeon]
MKLKIRQYDLSDEEKWVKCHFLSYYDSIYLDELVNFKPRYEGLVIQLVAIVDEEIVGILDIEIEQEAGQFGIDETSRCGMISVIGVVSQFRRRGIGTALLFKAQDILVRKYTVHRFEIWIREDLSTLAWLEKNDFQKIHHYYQIKLSKDFFEKYKIIIPFEVSPVTLIGDVEDESFKQLSQEHSPESSFKIIGLGKLF